MKKFLRLLFVFTICLFTSFSLISCNETTNASEEKPTEEITGGEQTPGDTTNPSNPNPIVPVEPPVSPTPHEHTYGEWQVVTAPTCTKTGTERRDCTGDCENYETREIEAIGHKTSLTNEIPATCENAGSQTYSCDNDNCDYTFTEEITTLGHKYVLTNETPATCETDGSQTFTCTNDNCEHTYTNTIPATGHNYQYVETITKTCTQDGYTLNLCHCGAKEHTNLQTATGHEFNANHQCEHCGLKQSPMEDLKDSVWFWVDNTSSTKWALCIKTLEGDQGTYCSYKGTYTDDVFTPNFSQEFNKYFGSFEVITTTNPDTGAITYKIRFEDDYIKQQLEDELVDYSHVFTLTFSGDEATGNFTLTGMYRDVDNNTFEFIGYKA